MARIARIIAPGSPHHITQRGNRREKVFFEEGDYRLYRDLLAEACLKHNVAVWAYCLMPNHVHLLLVPEEETGLAQALSWTHRRYTIFVNTRARQTGHLFQGRFSSVAMDEAYCLNAARYIALNPVRAHLVQQAQDWPWSSVRAHLEGRDDGLVGVQPLLDRAPRFADLLEGEPDDAAFKPLRAAEKIGRLLGSDAFIAGISQRLGRSVAPQKRGRKPKADIEKNKAGVERK